MESLKFRTNIKCNGCITTITPYLNEAVGDNNWEVDLQSPEKVLTIHTGDKTKEAAVIQKLQEAGYKGEPVS